jgi:hypothetical protein
MSNVQVYAADVGDKGIERLLEYLDERRLIDRDIRHIRFNPELPGAGYWHLFFPPPSRFLIDASQLLESMNVDVSEKPPLILNGSGSFHHLTYGFCRKIVDTFCEPYTIIHIDSHEDGATRKYKSADRVRRSIECGYFYPRLLADSPFAQAVIFVTGRSEIYSVNEKGNVSFLRYKIRGGPSDAADMIAKNIKTKNIYWTVDLDALSSQDVKTDWYNGGMGVEFLTGFVNEVGGRKKTSGADICGLRRGGRVSTDFLRTNERCLETNAYIFSTFRKLMEKQS